MADQSTKRALGGFVFYLTENKYLDEQVASNAFQEAAQNKVSYIDFLIKKKLLTEANLAKATAEYFGLPLCDIKAFRVDLIPIEYLNMELVRKRQALPVFMKSGFLYLAVTDPTNEHLYESQFLTGHDIRLLIAEESKLINTVDKLLNTLILSEIGGHSKERTDEISVQAYKEDNAELAAYDAESAPVVNYVNKVILDAIEKGVSDIHFERYENDFRIRYRLHGTLYAIGAPPVKLANFILARIKIMSNLDITEHRIPQDGRFKITLPKKRTVDFRVSICPMLFGEKVVLRILDMSNVLLDLDKLGMEPIDEKRLREALSHTQGIILVTGPTGSGKTVTLYSSLKFLNSLEDNISAAEDPVEITMHGVNQVHVNPKVGLTFATALRSFLRQDPDIIMVGEIRDLETAEIAVKAAQTGHLVLSTLHTNSGPETIVRLMNMGIAPYNLASSLILVVAQRLVRVLCHHCKQEEFLPDEVLLQEGFKKEEIGTFKLYKAASCNHCVNGYVGRTGIFEVMPISEEMSYLIMRGENSIVIAKQAKSEGVVNLREAGLKKVKEGITNLVELNRAFK